MHYPIRQGAAVLVDHNAFQRKMLRTVLRNSGFTRVSEFEALELGLDEASRTYPDFIFIDYETAHQSELMRGQNNLSSQHLSPSTNLIILMSQPTKARVGRAIASGAKWVVSRPFSPRSLNLRLRATIDPSFGVTVKQPDLSKKGQRNAAQEDVGFEELAAQMDALLKQSRYYQTSKSKHKEQTRSQIEHSLDKLEKEVVDRHDNQDLPQDDVLLI